MLYLMVLQPIPHVILTVLWYVTFPVCFAHSVLLPGPAFSPIFICPNYSHSLRSRPKYNFSREPLWMLQEESFILSFIYHLTCLSIYRYKMDFKKRIAKNGKYLRKSGWNPVKLKGRHKFLLPDNSWVTAGARRMKGSKRLEKL